MKNVAIFLLVLFLLSSFTAAFAESETAVDAGNGELILGVVIMALGAIHLAFPKLIWKLIYGWQYKNARPTQTAIVTYRIVGVALICAGAFILFA